MMLTHLRRGLLTLSAAAALTAATAAPASAATVPSSDQWRSPWSGSVSTSSHTTCGDPGASSTTCSVSGTGDGVTGDLSSSASVMAATDTNRTTEPSATHDTALHLSIPTPAVVSYELDVHAAVRRATASATAAGGSGAADAVMVVTGTVPCNAGRCSVRGGPVTIIQSNPGSIALTEVSVPIHATSDDPDKLLPSGTADLDVTLSAGAGLSSVVTRTYTNPSSCYAGEPPQGDWRQWVCPLLYPRTVTDPAYSGNAAADSAVTVDEVAATYSLVPAQPGGVTIAYLGGGKATLSWHAPPSPRPLTGYRVQRVNAVDGRVTELPPIGPSTTRLRDTGLVPGNDYLYYLYALNDQGASAASFVRLVAA